MNNGWVTLRGSVAYYYQRDEAEYVVRRVLGVRGITDYVELSSDAAAIDVADRVNRAFHRNAIIDDSRITITDTDHTVYLDGTVGSWFAMDEAVDTAWQAPGVQNVVNRLAVTP